MNLNLKPTIGRALRRAACLLALILGVSSSAPLYAQTAFSDSAGINAIMAQMTNDWRFTFAGSTFVLTNTLQVVSTNYVTVFDGGTNMTMLDGKRLVRLINVTNGATLVLQNLTLANGIASNGAAIFNNGTVLMSNVVVVGNLATNTAGQNGADATREGYDGGNGGNGGSAKGGAIYSTGALTIVNSIFGTNAVYAGDGGKGGNGASDPMMGGHGGSGGSGGYAHGGAIWCSNTTAILNCTFDYNYCVAGNGADGGAGGSAPFPGNRGNGGSGGPALGGAICNWGTLTVTNSTFIDNATWGGYSGSRVEANGLAGGAGTGGAIYNQSNVYLLNCTFYTNRSNGGAGGGIAYADSTYKSGNGGAAQGGAVASVAGTAGLMHCTLAFNSVYGGTNGYNAGGNYGSVGGAQGGALYRQNGKLGVTNSILLNGDGANTYGTIIDGGYNISSDNSSLTNKTTQKNLDPLLAETLEDNRGTTQTFALQDDSPAIDAIPSTNIFAATDQRGVPRPQGGAADIGAYEAATFYEVTGHVSYRTNSVTNCLVQALTVRGKETTLTDFQGNYSFELLEGNCTIKFGDAPSSIQPSTNFMVIPSDNAITNVNFAFGDPLFFLAEKTYTRNGGFRVGVFGAPNTLQLVLFSTNLTSWYLSASNAIPAGGVYTITYTNMDAKSDRQLYIRTLGR